MDLRNTKGTFYVCRNFQVSISTLKIGDKAFTGTVHINVEDPNSSYDTESASEEDHD